MADYLAVHRELEGPYARFEPAMLGPRFADELALVSRLWLRCAPMLPEATRRVFHGIYPRARPWLGRRTVARLLGRFLMKQARGAPRTAVPVAEAARS